MLLSLIHLHCTCTEVLLLMDKILHQLIQYMSHYLQGFTRPRWCRISSINSMSSHSTGASTDSKHAQTAYFIACDFCNWQIQGTHCFATVAGYLRLFGAGVEFRRTFLWRRAQTHLMNRLLDLGIDAIRDRITSTQ